MIRARGKNAGERLTLVQFCNDWISADDTNGEPVIVDPLTVRLEPGEAQIFLDDPDPGIFWRRYEISGDTFVPASQKRDAP